MILTQNSQAGLQNSLCIITADELISPNQCLEHLPVLSLSILFFSLLFMYLFIYIFETSLCSLGFPEFHYVDQAEFKLTENCLSLPLNAEIKECTTVSGLGGAYYSCSTHPDIGA